MRLFFIIVLCLMITGVSAQDSTVNYRPEWKEVKSFDIWLGYSLQGNWSDETAKSLTYLEIGIGKGRYFYSRHAISGVGVYLSEELLLKGRKRIYGTKLGLFVHSLIGIGLSVVSYTDFKSGNLKLRPELGFGVGRVGILVGYNIPIINNTALPELEHQNAQVTFRAGFGLKKKESKRS